MINNSQKKDRMIEFCIIFISVLVQVSFLTWVSYQHRFYINNDTIGSLDSAKYLRRLEIGQAINASWGIGFALLLSFTPNITNSWFEIHLLMMGLVIGCQFLVYRSLLHLGIKKPIAGMLSVIYGASTYGTRSALFLTADIPLCFIASIYLYVVSKSKVPLRIPGRIDSVLLGFLHAIAGLTKTIALLSLMPLPFLTILRLWCEKDKIKRIAYFSLAYFGSFLLVLSIWSYFCSIKYRRVTFGDAPAYNYALFVLSSPQLLKAEEKARHALPVWGTYWWSDFALSLVDWDHAIHLDVSAQLKRILYNVIDFTGHPDFLLSLVSLLLIALGVVGSFLANGERKSLFMPSSSTMLISLFALSMYLCTLFLARYLPFVTLFCIPSCADMIQRQIRICPKVCKKLIVVLACLAVLHGAVIAFLSSIYIAPGGEHFAIVQAIRASGKPVGPIGAFLAEGTRLYHHGVIAHLLGVKAAEIRSQGDVSKYMSEFVPMIVLLAFPGNRAVPSVVTVNSQEFELIGVWVYGKVKTRQETLAIYSLR
jgi:hypothetical protein